MFEVTKELLDSHEALLEIVFEESTVDEAKRRAALKISREVNIPGFRKGKAPYAKVLQYVGEPTVIQEAAELLMDEAYPQILEKGEVSPYGPGEYVSMQPSPLTLKIRVPLQPTVELGDYHSLREPWVDPSVSGEEVTQTLEQMREEHAILEHVDRPAAMGDEVVVDVKAVANGDVIVEENEIEIVLSESRPFLSHEFVAALVGMSVDETKQVTLVLPETVEEPSLRGVEADFTLTVKHVHERALPNVDDALASTVGSFETVAELEQDIRQRIIRRKQDQTLAEYRAKLSAQLVEQATVAYPPLLLKETLDDIVDEASKSIESQRKMSLEDGLRLDGLTLEQFREQMRPQAEARIRRSLALSKLAELENVTVSDEEVVQEYTGLMGRLGVVEELSSRKIEVDSPLGRNLRSSALGRKVLDRLASIGRGEGQVPGYGAEVPKANGVDVAEHEVDASAGEVETPKSEADA
ncbi:MAG: trigger factor [Anaerolineae bacterium]|nr:trigger factor [Anaerolineae bacterium]